MSDRFSPSSWDEVEAYLAAGKDPDDRPYPNGRATRVQRRGKYAIAVRYHETDVVLYTPEFLKLQTDGWRTSTTKQRINDALYGLPGYVSVHQDKGVWYLSVKQQNTVPFYDGLTIDWEGNLLDNNTRFGEEEQRRVKWLNQKINAYVRKVRQAIEDGTLDRPNAGDCWHCYMREVGTGVPLGDLVAQQRSTERAQVNKAARLLHAISNDELAEYETEHPHEHLLSHLREGYVVPSLVFNAVEERGSRADQESLWYEVSGEGFNWVTSHRDPLEGRKVLSKRVGRYVAAYLKVRLGIAR